MLEAAFWGLVTAGSLWVGAALALTAPVALDRARDGLRLRRAHRSRRLRARARRVARTSLPRPASPPARSRSTSATGRSTVVAARTKEHGGRQAARRERERDRPRHVLDGIPSRSSSERARAGRRRADCRRRRRVRLERSRGAVRDDGPSRRDGRARGSSRCGRASSPSRRRLGLGWRLLERCGPRRRFATRSPQEQSS